MAVRCGRLSAVVLALVLSIAATHAVVAAPPGVSVIVHARMSTREDQLSWVGQAVDASVGTLPLSGELRSGDLVQVALAPVSEGDGYLYAIAIGSSGKLQLLADALPMPAGDRRVIIPGVSQFLALDDRPGNEAVVAFSSDKPLERIDESLDAFARVPGGMARTLEALANAFPGLVGVRFEHLAAPGAGARDGAVTSDDNSPQSTGEKKDSRFAGFEEEPGVLEQSGSRIERLIQTMPSSNRDVSTQHVPKTPGPSDAGVQSTEQTPSSQGSGSRE